MPTTVPPVLYKYRDFSSRTVSLLSSDTIYCADPNTFNDPLDSKPCVEVDCDVPTLERTVRELVRRRVEAEMKAGAKAVKYRGPKTMLHIDVRSKAAAQSVLDTLAYHATNPEYSKPVPGPYIDLLSSEIERELLKQHHQGVLSLAKRFDCPLMWSHYGDQHRGLCLGYSVPARTQSQVHRVTYGGVRNVRASSVAAMLDGDHAARAEVDQAVLLRKAQDWRYEKEWRLLGSRGLVDSPFELVEVVFGMRCDGAVKHATASALDGREGSVKLYEMHEVQGTFRLKRRRLDVGQLSSYYPRRALSASEAFDSLDDEDETRSDGGAPSRTSAFRSS
jgi:hypothetical protein